MKKLFGLLAIAALVAIAAPVKQAEAAMFTPGVASAVQESTQEALTTEVRHRRHHWHPRRHYHPRRHWHRHHYHPRVHRHYRRW